MPKHHKNINLSQQNNGYYISADYPEITNNIY
jgi:hypothetical protein